MKTRTLVTKLVEKLAGREARHRLTWRLMIPEKLEQAFNTARKLYELKQFESGMIDPIPFAYAYRNGELLVFSAFGKHSADIAAKLGITLSTENPST